MRQECYGQSFTVGLRFLMGDVTKWATIAGVWRDGEHARAGYRFALERCYG